MIPLDQGQWPYCPKKLLNSCQRSSLGKIFSLISKFGSISPFLKWFLKESHYRDPGLSHMPIRAHVKILVLVTFSNNMLITNSFVFPVIVLVIMNSFGSMSSQQEIIDLWQSALMEIHISLI